ncbi:hypothetical protein SAMN05444274_102231 [Mariniphaga anaerophila]|uniref:Uncharacterized protein n=1 Tax=Mariniphaga anaerophila TaxID=1484053 RepID=A0A1M4VWS5_9BACT|nr:DUF6786 family protein [Mariniphaga anaerophila]SHE73182.1 hypothetical protein SAMN05444274_102231 [Mariniphaga anaerophila]
MKNIIIFIFASLVLGCSNINRQKNTDGEIQQEVIEIEAPKEESLEKYEKGTYGYDVNFLKKYPATVELKNGNSKLILSLKYQGRVMTSSSDGYGGRSYGWINHDLISSEKTLSQFNPVGGEERFWLGPESGQYSLFFEPGSSFDFENWSTPACIDTDPFEVFLATDSVAVFLKSMTVKNYSNFEFNFDLTRKVELMGKDQIAEKLDISVPENIKWVGYETTNMVKNTGQEPWKKETGLVSIWLLGMFNPSPSVTMIIPYKTGVNGPVVKDDYFGKIPDDRLKISDGLIYFKGDGKQRGKLGIPPHRAMPFMGSYDSKNRVFTLVKCDVPQGATDYVNSAWEHQKYPYKGDAVNAYNDGPLADGGQLGPFYELESSSPALALAPDSTGQYIQSTYHFEGTEEQLNSICQQIFDVSLEEVKNVF